MKLSKVLGIVFLFSKDLICATPPTILRPQSKPLFDLEPLLDIPVFSEDSSDDFFLIGLLPNESYAIRRLLTLALRFNHEVPKATPEYKAIFEREQFINFYFSDLCPKELASINLNYCNRIKVIRNTALYILATRSILAADPENEKAKYYLHKWLTLLCNRLHALGFMPSPLKECYFFRKIVELFEVTERPLPSIISHHLHYYPSNDTNKETVADNLYSNCSLM